MIRFQLRAITTVAIVLGLTLSTSAELITFDSLAPTADSVSEGKTVRPGAFTELPMTVAGTTVTIKRAGGSRFDLIDNTLSTQPPKAEEWGSYIPNGEGTVYKSVSLDFFFDTSSDPVVVNFSDVIHTFSILVGDYGQDLDTLWLFAFTEPDAQGEALNTLPVERQIGVAPAGTWTDTRFHIHSDTGFKSVVFYGGLGDLSVFMDRIYFSRNPEAPLPAEGSDPTLDDAVILGDDVTIIPEPASVVIFGTGIGMIALGTMRRRRDAA